LLSLAVLIIALLLDAVFGEPRRWHPIVGFGNFASRLESMLNKGSLSDGLIAWIIAVLPLTALAFWAEQTLSGLPALAMQCLIVYIALGRRSLHEHARAVALPLAQGDIVTARAAVAMIVSRDTDNLTENEIARAATESVLENGADAVLNAIFWYLLAGLPGIVLYRLSNTLDAMWGYRNPRFERFGKVAARADDVLNYIPARLTALAYALAGETKQAIQCWREQADVWKSPNAGPVMAAGAGAINVSLGGSANYHGETIMQPMLGPEPGAQTAPNANSIDKACKLLDRALVLWLAIAAAIFLTLESAL
jgi:adenosylcobinamide-phosphate synthase